MEVEEQLPDQLGRCPGGGSADGGGEDGADAAGQIGRGHVAVGGVEGMRIEQADQGVFGALLLPRSAFRGCAPGVQQLAQRYPQPDVDDGDLARRRRIIGC
ncbi:MAG: hypothetical protein M3Y35_18985 [Actinomycetota bacterium]|nr:hypothetical protein [Actinomycetota bacterium]